MEIRPALDVHCHRLLLEDIDVVAHKRGEIRDCDILVYD